MTPLLSVRNVTKHFRGLTAVDHVNLDVISGEIVAVIGPNGAGKTTLFSLIAGALTPDDGTIAFDGARIEGLSPDRICQRGVARTFQVVRPFPALTVEENVAIGAMLRQPDMKNARERARAVLNQIGLFDKRNQYASSLTLPDRKRLEVARALATDPKLLLLDEVMAGLRPSETDRMVDLFRALNRDTGVTVVLIEHVMRAVMALASRALVLHHGVAIAEGSPAQIARDPAVVQSYLGTEALG
jgi:branched-chain amino acid transport system ATP-binding protein